MQAPYSELWANAPGTLGMYMVSTAGRVANHKTGRLRKLSVGTHGYLYVLYKRRQPRTLIYSLVHRLVALAFVPNPCPERFKEVDHINGDKHDNRACNLRWVDRSANQQNRVKSVANGTPYVGVFRVGPNTWRACITRHGVRHITYALPSELEAAVAYNDMARRLFGPGARLNEVSTQQTRPRPASSSAPSARSATEGARAPRAA